MNPPQRTLFGRNFHASVSTREYPELVEAQRDLAVSLLRADAERQGFDPSTEEDLSWREVFYRFETYAEEPERVVCPEEDATYVLTTVEASYEANPQDKK